MTKPSTAGAGMALLALTLLAACSGADRQPPNVLLISVDTLRRDHVSSYGHDRPTTPAIDRLATEGARFDDALSPTSWTLPAHASLFTGLPPSVHQQEDRDDPLANDLVTLAEAFRKRGYATASFASHVFFEPVYGLDRGFEVADVGRDQPAEKVTEKALGWLGEHRGPPFFLFVHYFDPHWDYAPPEPFLGRFADPRLGLEVGTEAFLKRFVSPYLSFPARALVQVQGLYDGEIAYADAQIGRLIDQLRDWHLLDRTIVAVTSDHGEEFRDHGSFGHGLTLHAEITRIPLILRYPARIPAGQTLSDPVLLSDLPATLTSLAGGEPPAQFLRLAVDLAPRLAGAGDIPPPARSRFLEATCFGEKRLAVVRDGHKYVAPTQLPYPVLATSPEQPPSFRMRRVPEALYCLGDDPEETTNLLARRDEAAPGAAHPDPAPAAGCRHHRDLAALRAELRAELARFIREQVTGVRLTCRPPASGDRPLAGIIRFDRTPLDEPFGLGFEDGDEVTIGERYQDQPAWMTRRWDEYRFSLNLTAGGEPKGLVLPVAPQARQIALSLTAAAGEAAFWTGTLTIPEPRQSVPLPEAAGVACVLEGGPRRAGSGKGSGQLDAGQLEALRALGYVH